MYVLAIRAILTVFLLIALACSDERPLQPLYDPLQAILHLPYEDQEAEELALELSAELIAPESLYLRLHRDLTAIREVWADSLPIVTQRRYRFRYAPGEVVIFLHDGVNVAEWLTRTTELELIRAQYGFDSLRVTENRITLKSRYRINTAYLLGKLERLPGVCWAQPGGQSREPFGAAVNGDTIDYGFVVIGVCIGICFPSHYYWFSSDSDTVAYVGHMTLGVRDTIPDEFKAVWRRKFGTSHADQLDSITFRDETPPARATDMKFIGEQVGRTGTISFTATGDDGNEGAAYSATVCVATQIITDENFNTVGFKYVKVNPGFSGDEHVLSFDNLAGDKTNYYAVRFIDCNQNLSRVSNIAQSRNIWLNGWTYFNAANSPMPSNQITNMIRDSRGRMWLGTHNGLACKDGEQWQVYQTSNSAIPYDLITSVAEGPDGTIWVGTPYGLGRFDGSEWRSFTKANSDIPKEEISRVAVALDGTVWLGYGQYGAVSYDQRNWTVYTPANSPLKGTTVYALSRDSRGAIWIGTNRGVNRFNAGIWTVFDPTNSGIGGLAPYCFFEDADGAMWIGTSADALSKFDGVVWSVQRFEGWHVNALAQYDHGTIWIGADGGLWRHHENSWLGISGAISGLLTNHCTGLVAENPDVLWIATGTEGLCRWDLKSAGIESSQAARFVGK